MKMIFINKKGCENLPLQRPCLSGNKTGVSTVEEADVTRGRKLSARDDGREINPWQRQPL